MQCKKGKYNSLYYVLSCKNNHSICLFTFQKKNSPNLIKLTKVLSLKLTSPISLNMKPILSVEKYFRQDKCRCEMSLVLTISFQRLNHNQLSRFIPQLLYLIQIMETSLSENKLRATNWEQQTYLMSLQTFGFCGARCLKQVRMQNGETFLRIHCLI